MNFQAGGGQSPQQQQSLAAPGGGGGGGGGGAGGGGQFGGAGPGAGGGGGPSQQLAGGPPQQFALSNSAAIRAEIQRFESVHPNIYAIYDLIERIEDLALQNQIREHVISIEGERSRGLWELGHGGLSGAGRELHGPGLAMLPQSGVLARLRSGPRGLPICAAEPASSFAISRSGTLWATAPALLRSGAGDRSFALVDGSLPGPSARRPGGWRSPRRPLPMHTPYAAAARRARAGPGAGLRRSDRVGGASRSIRALAGS
ncbi:hypothetical protein P7K49_025928 [Saguinus oedipus]|uniref:Arf-GAP with GTPase, ANK repeat and PH domain-containing protein 3 n=1 Tax=Saguinus oedipus TaxID=9490 RepID=A0ABQ9UJC4_SAGOE|nr:hypothetical protein P7K49_025928 [Saguinus oedipus]